MTKGRLTYGVEFTRNLGNFENVKPRFELSMDLDTLDEDEVDDAHNLLTAQVDKWLTDKVAELETELKELGLGKN